MKNKSLAIALAAIGTVCLLAFPVHAQWVINEILADPPDGAAGDANGDGVRDASEDEFVEIVNDTGGTVDISGWTISDEVGVRHTFPGGTSVPDGHAIVVFGGGTPTGLFGDCQVQTASSGLLGFNNDGDTATLANGGGDVAAYTYGAEGGNNNSLTRNPDITGADPLVEHVSVAAPTGGCFAFSPGLTTGCDSLCPEAVSNDRISWGAIKNHFEPTP